MSRAPGDMPVLTTVDKLRAVWEQSVRRAPEAEFAEARMRNLRRHAIETGIIERLYDLDWGVTEALVTEAVILAKVGVTDTSRVTRLEELRQVVRDRLRAHLEDFGRNQCEEAGPLPTAGRPPLWRVATGGC